MKMKFIRPAASLLAAVLIFAAVQRLVMPKYMTDIFEGAMTAEYYDETTAHDCIFLGDCEVYENFSPITLWEEYGITSYIRGSAQQLVWQSYYLLEETLKYEKAEVVVFSVLAMRYSEPQTEAYNRLLIDGMRPSVQKYRCALESMTPGESFASYVFPLLRYHSRWSELTAEDIEYYFKRDKVSHNGFLMRSDVRPLDVLPVEQRPGDFSFGERSWEYLERITQLCRDNDITLVLIKAPSVYPYWFDEWDKQIADYASENGLDYINLLDRSQEIGLDFSLDTYDGGLHLNLSGAQKLSQYFGGILSERYCLTDHRSDPELSAVWEQKTEFYYDMLAHQQYELSVYGELISY